LLAKELVMTQNQNVGGSQPGGSSSGEFDTVELRGAGSAASSGTTSGVGASTSASMGSTTSAGATGSSYGSGTAQGSSSGTVGRAVDQAQDRAGQAVDQVQQTASQVVDQAKETVTSQVESQKDRLAESVSSVAQAIRQTGEGLRGQQQGAVAGYADTAADYVEQLGTMLRERDLNEIIGEVEYYARRNPIPFLGGAFALGFAISRFLKSSRQSQYESQSGGYGSRGYTYRGSQYPYGSGYQGASRTTTTYPSGSTRVGTRDYGSTAGSAGTYGTTGTSYGAGTTGTTGGTSYGTTGTTGGASYGGTGTTGTSDYTTGGGMADRTTGSGSQVGSIGTSDQFSARREDQ
jgi:hypothetical protein